MDHFLKVFFEFVTILLLFYVLVFGRKACGILAPQPGIEPAPPALEGEVLTTGPPGKSLCSENLTSLKPKILDNNTEKRHVSKITDPQYQLGCTHMLGSKATQFQIG